MIYSKKQDTPRAERLLSCPTNEQSIFSRQKSNYQNNSDRFRVKNRSFCQQFAHIYATRLQYMRPKLEKVAREKWSKFLLLLLLLLFYFVFSFPIYL